MKHLVLVTSVLAVAAAIVSMRHAAGGENLSEIQQVLARQAALRAELLHALAEMRAHVEQLALENHFLYRETCERRIAAATEALRVADDASSATLREERRSLIAELGRLEAGWSEWEAAARASAAAAQEAVPDAALNALRAGINGQRVTPNLWDSWVTEPFTR